MFPTNFIVKKINNVCQYVGFASEPKLAAYPNDLAYNELIFHLSGKMDIYFNGTLLNMEANQVRFLPQGSVSQYVVRRLQCGVCIDIFFATDVPISSEAFSVDMNNSSKMRELFLKCYALWIKKDPDYYFRCMSILYQIISIIIDNTYAPQERFSLLALAEEYIVENYTKENISIPSLARMCGISESYFKQLFTAKHGMTPKKHITRMRIDLAGTYLQSTLNSVTEVAELTGFENVYYFSKVFKQETGLTPSEYIKKFTGTPVDVFKVDAEALYAEALQALKKTGDK